MAKTINHEQLIALLEKKQRGRTASELAEELGISGAYLSDIFKGKRNAGPKVLEQLGLEQTVVYQEVED
jgi:transcriptional regulator with XRE-family HTH domain